MDAPGGRFGRLAPRRWSMRIRLIVVLMALLAAVSLVVVAVTVVVLRGYLLDQVDGRLQAAARRPAEVASSRRLPPPSAGFGQAGGLGEAGRTGEAGGPGVPGDVVLPPDAAPPFLLALGQSEGTIGAEVLGGEVLAAAFIDTTGVLRPLSVDVERTLARVPVGREPGTVHLGELGDYRLLAVSGPDGVTRLTGLPLADANATLVRLTAVAGGVAAAGTAAAGIIGTMIVRRALRPLRRVATAASRVAELPLDRGEVVLPVRIPGAEKDPRTEVGQVSIALERLLGHVEAALSARHASEMRVRRFVADASHELRTPLAAISGYAELTRRIHDTLPADVVYAMRRVESESARMTTLVEDLLLLARLDAGRPLAHEPVDLSRLVVDATSDAHVAAPGHRWELDLPEAPVAVVGDAARLHQVLANLLANARTHTPPGTRVTVSLTVDETTYPGLKTGPGPGASPGSGTGDRGGGRHRSGREQAVISVVDDGPGIPPALLPNVFERFARGDESRSRAAGSTGLGLAIVAAVVEAHHGRVEAASVSGRTAFTVRLPLTPPPNPCPTPWEAETA